MAPDLTALPAMRFATRISRLRELLESAECDALLVTKLVNIRYLTGFTGSAALLVVFDDDALFVTDGRYGEQATEQLSAAGVVARIETSNTEQKEITRDATARVASVGLESDDVTWAQYRRLDQEWFPDLDLVATETLVEGLRIVKDEGEVARVEAAAAIADAALAAVIPRLDEKPTEREFALELDFTMRRLGATAPSFETIVASGPNGAKPHARPSDRVIVEGDLVVIDFGAIVDGYCSDMTRTMMIGEPTPTQQRMYDVVFEAQQAGVESVRAGVEVKAIDAVCRDFIEESGWGHAFLHSTGHGVGLEIHEAPRVAATADATLAVGNVVTVEPGVYLSEHGGVRIEDTLVVTEDGCRALTLAPKLEPV